MDASERAAAARSTAAAAREVADTVEQVSQAIRANVGRFLPSAGPAADPMTPINMTNDLVHSAIRALTPLVGEAVAQSVAAAASDDAPSVRSDPDRAAALAGLAAAFGDRLPSELTPQMGYRTPTGAGPAAGVAVFVHGLGGHGGQWSDGYLQIAQQAGLDPVLVDYNTGLPIAQNAAAFADLMTELVAAEPAVERIVFVAHSMGGLVVTAAIDTAPQPTPDAGSTDWRSLVTDVVTLGTPHEGAPLERVSDFALRAASRWPTAAPIANLGHFRSQGIKDLARGYAGSLPDDIHHHAVVANLGTPGSPIGGTLGDGLVPPRSAAGRSPNGKSVTVTQLFDTGHNALLDHDEVAALLARILDEG
jgi:pimeloyl-ACP methyl ester carboxylesterase